MALLKFISLSVGSLMLLQGAYATNSVATTNTTNCLDLMNKARKEVGLSDFAAVTPEGKQYLTNQSANTSFLPKVCERLKANTPIIVSEKTDFGGATAAYLLNSEDCSAAVDAWKKGFSVISPDKKSLPVAFQLDQELGDSGAEHSRLQTGKAPYDTPTAVNFIALYNGQTAATTAECGVVTCDGSIKALVCMTYPVALKAGSSPYNETQWANILKVLAPESSSASAAVPTLLALAAAAVGVALM